MEFLQKLKPSETLFIASIPLAGYISAYYYQLGYFSFYKLPTFMITVTFESAISASLISLIVMSSLIFIIYITLKKSPETPDKIPPRPSFWSTLAVSVLLSVILPIAIFSIETFPLILKVSFSLLIGALLMGMALFLPRIKYSGEKDYWTSVRKYYNELYKKQLIPKPHQEDFPQIRFPTDPFLFKIIVSIIFFIGLIAISFFAGYIIPESQEEYYVTQVNGEDFIVLRTISESALAISLDRKTHKTGNTIELIPSSQLIALKLENLGKLNESSKSSIVKKKN